MPPSPREGTQEANYQVPYHPRLVFMHSSICGFKQEEVAAVADLPAEYLKVLGESMNLKLGGSHQNMVEKVLEQLSKDRC